MERVLRLNIETNEEVRVIEELRAMSTHFKAFLANRPARGIVEIDLTSDEPRVISIENIKDALYWIPSWKIRFTIG